MLTAILVIVVILIVIGFLAGGEILHSHWAQLIDGMKFSTKEFYSRIEKELQNQGVKGITTREVSLSEGGLLSSNRIYLRVEWKEYTYDLCFAPFGNGVFVSWWLYSKPQGAELVMLKIPGIGTWLASVFFPNTYYRVDTASMFMTYAQSSVLAVVDSLTKEQGLKSLSDTQRTPVMKDIFSRK